VIIHKVHLLKICILHLIIIFCMWFWINFIQMETTPVITSKETLIF
jgi:hypothetical protein